MKSHFLKMGHPKWLIYTKVEMVKFRWKSRKREKEMKQIPLIIIYDPLLKDFDCVIRKHLYILYLNKEVKQIFTPSFMVSVRGAKELGI